LTYLFSNDAELWPETSSLPLNSYRGARSDHASLWHCKQVIQK